MTTSSMRRALIVHPLASAKFRAMLGDIELCVSETPFFDGAREMLKRGLANEGDTLEMWHAGAKTWSLRSTVCRAAAYSISQPSAGKAPRLVKFEPFDRRNMKSAMSMGRVSSF